MSFLLPKRRAVRLPWTLVIVIGWWVAIGGAAHASVPPSPLQRWDLRYPNRPDLADVIFANGTFVALPASGLGPPFTSKDGLNWLHSTVHAESWISSWSGIGYGNNTFVAVTRAGQVLLAENATSWTESSVTPVAESDADHEIRVAAGNGLIVTASDSGFVSVSGDGATWTEPQLLEGCPRRLCFGNDIFLTVLSCAANSSLGAWTSADGFVWNPPANPLAASLLDVSFSGGLFIGVTLEYGFVLSVNGIDWVQVGTAPVQSDWPPTYFVQGNGQFVGFSLDPGGDSLVFTSPDGANWVQSATIHDPKGLAFGNGRFVISGTDTLVSNDAQLWTTLPNDDGGLPSSVAFGNGRFVAVGGKFILSSADGQSWQRVLNPGTTQVPVGIYFANGLFLGPSWPSYNEADRKDQQGVLLTSSDGLAWTEHVGPTFLSSLRNIVYGDGMFVAIGEGHRLFASEDGVDWREAANTEFLSNVVFGNGIFLASAHTQGDPNSFQSIMYGSSDGLTWVPLTTLNGRMVMLSAYANGVFVAQTLDSPARNVLISQDGKNWSLVYTGRNPGIATGAYSGYGAGTFVILSPYTILSSPDAFSWTEEMADAAQPLADAAVHPALAFGLGTFVSVVRGTIQQSSPVRPPYSVRILSSGDSLSATGLDDSRFTFTRSGSPRIGIRLKVSFEIGGSAQMGVDYLPIPDFVVIPADQASVSLRVLPSNGSVNAADKSIVLTLLPGDDYTIVAPSSATLNVGDLTAPPPLGTPSIVLRPDGVTRIKVDSIAGSSFILEASSDLLQWDTVAVVPIATASMEFSDPQSATWSSRFYRLRSADLALPISGTLLSPASPLSSP